MINYQILNDQLEVVQGVPERLDQILMVITAFLLSTQLSELAILSTRH